MMSRDRVRFTLPPNHYQDYVTPPRKSSRNGSSLSSGFSANTMVGILRGAFGMDREECLRLFEAGRSSGAGFGIVCRPSQFARFIILRYQAREGINVVSTLEPELFVEDAPCDEIDVHRRPACHG